MRSKFKTLLIIGGSGFFAKSIIDNIYYYSFFKKIKKIILLSRSVNKIKIDRTVNNKFKIKTIRGDISKLKKIPFADYIIYCAINYNYDENGKKVIESQPIPGVTGGALDANESEPGPIMMQGDHGPIEYRNIILTPAK